MAATHKAEPASPKPETEAEVRAAQTATRIADAKARLAAKQRAALLAAEPIFRSYALHALPPHNGDTMRTARRIYRAPRPPADLYQPGISGELASLWEAFTVPFDHTLAAFDPPRAASAGLPIGFAPLGDMFPNQREAFAGMYQAFVWQPVDRANAIATLKAGVLTLPDHVLAMQADQCVVARSYTESAEQIVAAASELFGIEDEATARYQMLEWSGLAGTVKPAWEDGRTLDEATPEIQLYLNSAWGWQDYQGKALMSIQNYPDRLVLIETMGYDQYHIGESFQAKVSGFMGGMGGGKGGGTIVSIITGFLGAHEAGQASSGNRILGEMFSMREKWAAASGIENPSWRKPWYVEHWSDIAIGAGLVALLTWIFWPEGKKG